jgi:sec-independent protein translocase protein TatB
MFDIGIWELALIALLALIVLGPKRLPEVARMAGKWLGTVRRFVASVKEDFDQELRSEELSELRKLQQELSETRDLIQRSSNETLDRLQHDLDAEPASTSVEQRPERKSGTRSRTATKSRKPATASARTKKPVPRKKHARARRTR